VIRLQIYRKPMVVVGMLGLFAAVFCLLEYLTKASIFVVLAALYGFTFVGAVFSAYRIYANEKILHFIYPEKILIIATHQDDCVISAGGFGIRNLRMGGETHIAYITQEKSTEIAKTRIAEATESWRLAGTPMFYHMDILPGKYERNPGKIYEAAKQLQRLIDQICPTVLFIPLYEGGHVQHDITNYIISFLIKKSESLRIYECPAYSPYFSFLHTPHKVLGILSRVVLIFVSYFGLPEGLDGRKIFVLDLSKEELELKKKMLKSFASQGGDFLANTFGYPDRVIRWVERPYKSSPYRYNGSLSHTMQTLQETSIGWLVKRLFWWECKSIGREQGITNIDEELLQK
jgi:LmbE family N-acetylglucosaminyl deacetylase